MVTWGILWMSKIEEKYSSDSLIIFHKYKKFHKRMCNLFGYYISWHESLKLAIKAKVITKKEVPNMFGDHVAELIEEKMRNKIENTTTEV